jgi:2-iminoacetate synthase
MKPTNAIKPVRQIKKVPVKRWTLKDIIDDTRIVQAVAVARTAPLSEVRRIIEKAKIKKGLTPEETAVLLFQDHRPKIMKEILKTAKEIKEAVYGQRQVFFAPLYINNRCLNNCLYCAYRRDNTLLHRRSLSEAEIIKQVELLESLGHKRLLVVAGEVPGRFPEVVNAMKIIYRTRKSQGEIRRVNVNIAPPTVGQFRQLKKVGIGTYQCFQETYHLPTYGHMHPSGPKADYAWRLSVMDRAYRAKVEDVSLGILLGLYDYHYDVVAMVMHADYLDRRYNIGPHAVSVPRLKVAKGTPLCDDKTLNSNQYILNDTQFKLVVAVIRLALPYTGLIMSTRESAAMRLELMNAGVSQISAGSHVDVGGYSTGAKKNNDGQFEVEDTRPLDEVLRNVIESGNIPSFCTACYRCGRTGEKIMDLLKPGTIQQFCFPNALLTFQEYLEDYASAETRKLGIPFLVKQLQKLPTKVRAKTLGKLDRIRRGERDLFF